MGIILRDLKPQNILCDKPNSIENIKICDFGISKLLTNDKASMLKKEGTIEYIAPEILKCHKNYDKSVDFWSVGIIMFMLLCGIPPFIGENDNQVKRIYTYY